MDDIERAIDDGVNAYKALTKVLVAHYRYTGNELNCSISGVVDWVTALLLLVFQM